MTPEERAAFINSQVACALIELAGMQSENEVRKHHGQSPAYPEEAFQALMKKYLIGHNEVITFFNQ